MLTFGSDPEFIVQKDNKFISAIDIVQGDADNRVTVQGHQFYHDNVLAECAIKPGKSKDEVIENFKECFSIYANMISPYKLNPTAAHVYKDSDLDNPEARMAGCSPDWCAYQLKLMEIPQGQFFTSNLRVAGGHIHLGETKGVLLEELMHFPIVFLLDLFVGFPLMCMGNTASKKRRVLYGKAGRYRPTSYGIEYRTPDNHWLCSPKMVSIVYDLCKFVVNFVENKKYKKYWKIHKDKIGTTDLFECIGYDTFKLRKCIDTSNRKIGSDFMKILEKELPKVLLKQVNFILNQTPEPKDFYKEWQL